ncbi:AC11-like protein [Orgyia pseudotsugata single capsid nuclopolyhedrovirus]|nr:AC11-like protein [Orgyia pseudotsugata single capsid nuclopolyhedrovirus]
MEVFSKLCVYNYFINFEVFSSEIHRRKPNSDVMFLFGDRVNTNLSAQKDFYKRIIRNYDRRSEKENYMYAQQLSLARKFIKNKINAFALIEEVKTKDVGYENMLYNSIGRLLHYYTSGGTEADAGIYAGVLEFLTELNNDNFPSNRCGVPDDELAAVVYIDDLLNRNEDAVVDLDYRIESILRPALYHTIHSDSVRAIRKLAEIFGGGHVGSWYHEFTACAFISGLKRSKAFNSLDRFHESIEKWKAENCSDFGRLYGKMCGIGRDKFAACKRECVDMLFRIMNDVQDSCDLDHPSYNFVNNFAKIVADVYEENKKFIDIHYYNAKCDKDKNKIFGLMCTFDADQLHMDCNYIVDRFMKK